MAARKAPLPSHPAFYVATRDLMVGSAESGVMPVAAFRAGDRVPPALVEANHWGDVVTPSLFGDPEPEPPAPVADAGASPEAPQTMPSVAGKE